MIIGVDAGMLGITDDRLKVGVYWLVVNLLQQLRTLDTKNTYRLYSFAPIPTSLLQTFGANMENVVLRPTQGWFSLRLPAELFLRKPDVFLALGQGVPMTTVKTIGFVYDLGFLHHPDMYPGSAATMTSRTNKLIDRSHHIVTISHAVKADILEHYRVDEQKVHVVYPGVDASFTPRGEVLQTTRPYFLYVGSLKPGKNVPFIIAAFARFHKKYPKHELYLAGSDFWMDADISRAIQESDASSSIHRLSYVSDAELTRLYRGATAFVSPSLIEGFGLPVLEAMACGTPVIVSDIPVFDEVVGKAGMHVDPTDVGALATAMKEVIKEDTRGRLIKSGLAQAKKFSWTTFTKSIYSLYEA